MTLPPAKIGGRMEQDAASPEPSRCTLLPWPDLNLIRTADGFGTPTKPGVVKKSVIPASKTECAPKFLRRRN